MNDSDTVDVVRDSLTTAMDSLDVGVHVNTPLDAIVRNGRARRRRHRLTGVTGAVAVTAGMALAVTALALQLFKSDHDRQLPESLEQLTPKYLPAVPSDPFRPDAGPLGYLPGRKPPALYSVGLNMTDEHGSMRPARGAYGGRWLAQDAVFPLTP